MRRWAAGLVAVAVLACAGAPPATDAAREAKIAQMYAHYHEDFPDVPDVDPKGYEQLVAEGKPVVLVDVRTPEEQAVSMIPGAITEPQFEQHEDAYQGDVVVTYCTIGARSGEYAKKLRAQGWDARNMAGSILAWTHAGGPLVGPDGKPTQRVDVYGKKWDLAAKGYESTW